MSLISTTDEPIHDNPVRISLPNHLFLKRINNDEARKTGIDSGYYEMIRAVVFFELKMGRKSVLVALRAP